MTSKTVSFRLKMSVVDEIQRLRPLVNARSTSEFVIKAILYCLDNEECWKLYDQSKNQGMP
uniref:CopG family transcriptional regulator n=1 Tax=Metallosphaera hakonensis JCM 8857 = DSM 7519 TaxID=1293036 RepID=A0A2U9IUR7_9CREN